jgi:hypothetical protein
MPDPITDGLTLLRKLRDSHSPRKSLDLGLPVVSENPNASAEAVFHALQKGGASEGTLYKAQQLMQTGELQSQRVEVDPLDVLAIERGDFVPAVATPASAEQIVKGPDEEIAQLKAALEAEKSARLEAEAMLESMTTPADDLDLPKD